MCLKDLRDEFIYDCECRHLAKGSLRNYKAATRFLLEYLELKQITELEDVRPRHIRDLMKEKQDAGSTSRYINDLLKVWRTWFNYLVNEGYLEERDNPAKKVKCLRQPRTIIDTFTVAEMKRMIQFYDGKDFLEVRNKTIIMLLFDTGMADVAVAVTTGRPTMLFPDAAVTQGNVLVLTSEDDPGMSLAPRMIAAEADTRRVFYATPSWYWQQKKKKLVIGASLFELIDELRPALVIIDPLKSFLEGNATANGDVMRGALDMLQEKASADQFSVVIVSHMVKKAGDDARTLLAGSGELWNAARSVTILGRLPKDESITYVTQEKLNVALRHAASSSVPRR